jgi:hypothetical protein
VRSQRAQIAIHDVPDHVEIDVQIVVDDPVVHPDNGYPGNPRMQGAKLGRGLSRGLADGLKQVS